MVNGVDRAALCPNYLWGPLYNKSKPPTPPASSTGLAANCFGHSVQPWNKVIITCTDQRWPMSNKFMFMAI